MKKKMLILRKSQKSPVSSGVKKKLFNGAQFTGASHPPQNRMALSAHIKMTLAYSPSQKSAKLIDEYSVWWPATSSLSASTRSNGVRKVSAIDEMKNTTHIGNSKRLKAKPLKMPRPKPVCSTTMAERLKVPA